jgi:pimeloyl-ACP methyl ester carboxylesterase
MDSAREIVVESFPREYSVEALMAPVGGVSRVVQRPDGTRLATVSLVPAGDATRATVVLAHGFAVDRHEWNVVAPELVARGHRVVAFDQRGHGESTCGSDGIGTRQMVGDYLAILAAHDVRDGVIVGHSMGGFLLINALVDRAAEMGRHLRGAMLLATFAGDVNRSNPQNRVQIPLITSGVMSRLVRLDSVAHAQARTLLGRDKPMAAVRAFTRAFRAADLRLLVPILKAFVREDRYGDLAAVSMPCTVVVGTMDTTTPPFHTDELHAGIRGSRVVRVAERGHMLNWEAPDVIVDEVVKLAG